MKAQNIKVAIFVGLSLMFIMFSFYFYQTFYNPNVLIRKYEGELYIPKDATMKNVVDSMKKYNYLEDVVSFMFVSKILGYQEKIKPGRYILKKGKEDKGISNLDAVRFLRSGAQTPVQVTFNNIRLKKDLAPKICRWVMAEEAEFNRLINDTDFVASLGFDTTTITTMFLPNTYEMYWTTDAEALIKRMKREYDKFWNEERLAKAQKLNMTPVEVSVLASIVQSETKKLDEKPIVAGLYLNRIDKGMTLDSDPTVVFAIGDFSKRRVLKVDLQYDSPYNTYMYKGLPPGPITLPDVTSIDAVLNHENHNYIYMCAKEDFSGYHRFATNYRQHINNAKRYQRELNRRKVFR
ncbi:endolytic transglycosylase MltG [Flexithrix dorotheae]|uniref:endolytic transglycosylase MltG n=1 Tax=Flexithrix dorotheae TaxID=70993 RepID=UPI000379B6DA|nr:endolytic transglycosylase MltG [Flexithrix dorotheae]